MSANQVRAYVAKAREYWGSLVEKDLRRLLPLKTKAEYEPDDIAPGVASKAVERAQRCVAVAEAVAYSRE